MPLNRSSALALCPFHELNEAAIGHRAWREPEARGRNAEAMLEIKLLNKLKETLEQARRLAVTTDNFMQVYLIDMAILEADQMLKNTKKK
jgi:hypothetical protein